MPVTTIDNHTFGVRIVNVFPRLRSTLAPLGSVRRVQQPLTAGLQSAARSLV